MRRTLAVLLVVLLATAVPLSRTFRRPTRSATGPSTPWTLRPTSSPTARSRRRRPSASISAHSTSTADFPLLQHGRPLRRPDTGSAAANLLCPSGSNREYDYSIKSVTHLDGSKWKYDVSETQGKLTVKIGDADVTVSGPQTTSSPTWCAAPWTATTTTTSLYWDASGTWEESPIEQFTMSVNLPDGAETRAVCYEGFAGSDEQCVSTASGNTATYLSARELSPNEQVTIVAGWQRGIVEVGPPVLQDRATVSDFLTFDAAEFAGLLGSGILGLLIVFGAWYRYGRDKSFVTLHYLTNETEEHTRPLFGGPPVVVEFLPPEDLRPAQMGVLVDERADTLDVTATIVDLAVRGYLHITELPKKGWFGKNDWKLTKLKEAEDLNAFEKKVFNSLFSSSATEVELSDLRYKFAEDLAKAKNLIYDDAMKRKWFMQKPESARGMWVIVAIGLMFLGLGLSCFAALLVHRGLIFLGLIPAGFAMLIISRSMARRTALGSEMMRRVLGFRLYISTAEKYKQQFNEQENIFARYLPFAIVFGCVTKWAKAFEGLEATAQASTASWYTGTNAFSAAAFSSNLQSFSSSVGSTLSSTQSSGGSGFSGGSSGGGGGGGGGGSW
ncbi:MAG: DUF2207 domain-containing protein [Dehalococcoidia bacterium]